MDPERADQFFDPPAAGLRMGDLALLLGECVGERPAERLLPGDDGDLDGDRPDRCDLGFFFLRNTLSIASTLSASATSVSSAAQYGGDARAKHNFFSSHK